MFKKWRSTIRNWLKNSKLLSTMYYYLFLKGRHFLFRNNHSTIKFYKNAVFECKAAFICDEMTWQTLAPLFKEAVFLLPQDGASILHHFKPALFFCESAWEGIADYKGVWRGQIFRNHNVLFEHRGNLIQIVAVCKELGIPTVFWNKEDPVYFDEPMCDFKDTALYFDYICTTDAGCIERYVGAGAKKVIAWPFGFSAGLFNPLNRQKNSSGAVFAGSWFPEYPQRCKYTATIFDELLKRGIPLAIYDRQSVGGNGSFPLKYGSFVRGAIPYRETANLYRTSAYGININTVSESSTMFARRFLEMVACGLPVISSPSRGIEQRFGGKAVIWAERVGILPNEDDAHEMLKEVFLHDTNRERVRILLDTIGIAQMELLPTVDICCVGQVPEDIFKKIMWTRKAKHSFVDLIQLKKEIGLLTGKYVVFLNAASKVPDVAFWVTQTEFLPSNCGVSYGNERYVIEKTENIWDTLWPIDVISKESLFEMKQRYLA